VRFSFGSLVIGMIDRIAFAVGGFWVIVALYVAVVWLKGGSDGS